MVDLIHTLWKPSLKDAITTFKDNLQEQDRLLSHTNNISVTKVHLKDILCILLGHYRQLKIPGQMPFVTHLLFQETICIWKSIFLNIEKKVFNGNENSNIKEEMENEVYAICIEIILGFILLQPQYYRITNPYIVLKSLSNKILHQTNMFDIESFKIKELVSGFNHAIHLSKQENVECLKQENVMIEEEVKFEKIINNAIKSLNNSDNRTILESFC